MQTPMRAIPPSGKVGQGAREEILLLTKNIQGRLGERAIRGGERLMVGGTR